MPSAAIRRRADYFRRQADTCLRLSLVVGDDEMALRLIAKARDYKLQADALEMPEVVAKTVSDTGQC